MTRGPSLVLLVLILPGIAGCVLPEQPPQAPTAQAENEEALGSLLKPVTVYPERYREWERIGKVVDLGADLGVGQSHRSVFVPQDGQGYFILLENSQLEELEKYTRHGEKLVKVSGTVTLYDGRNYLLISRWARQEY